MLFTERALDTAAQLARPMPTARDRRRDESIRVKSGASRGRERRDRRLRLVVVEALGVRGLRPLTAEADRVGAPREDRETSSPRSADGEPMVDARHGDLRDAVAEDRSRFRGAQISDSSLQSSRRAVKGCVHRDAVLGPSRVEDFGEDGSFHQAGTDPGRKRGGGNSTRATTPARATPTTARYQDAGTNTSGPGPRGTAGPSPRSRSPYVRAAVPARRRPSSSTRRCSNSRSTRAAATRRSWIGCSGPRRRMPGPAS